MKAKMLPFIPRQGMCLGTPMGPSEAETATASSLPASNPAYPVSKATVEPGDGCTREATGIPQHFHVCPWFPIVRERITSVQIWKLFKHTKCLPMALFSLICDGWCHVFFVAFWVFLLVLKWADSVHYLIVCLLPGNYDIPTWWGLSEVPFGTWCLIICNVH